MLQRIDEIYTVRGVKLLGVLPGKVLLRWEVARFALDHIDNIAAEIGGKTHFKRMVDTVARHSSIHALVQAFNDANKSEKDRA